MDDPSTGPNMSPPEKEIGPKENIEQNLDSAQDEHIEQAGRVGVEAAKPSSGEFPQTVPPVKEQEAQIPSAISSLEEERSEVIPQKPSIASEKSYEELVSDIEREIDRLKSNKDGDLSNNLSAICQLRAKAIDLSTKNSTEIREKNQKAREDREQMKKGIKS